MMTHTRSRFEELKATGRMPSPTGVALEIVKLTQKENVCFSELGRLMQADPALTARVLKAANSSMMGVSRRIVSVSDATMLLGLVRVKQIALGFSLISSHTTGKCTEFDYPGYWAKSLVTAIAAQVIAEQFPGCDANEFFVLGIFSDIGKLALATLHPTEYAQVLTQAGDDDVRLAELEQGHFATDHIELTQALVTDWGLPEYMAIALGHYKRIGVVPMDEATPGYRLAVVLALGAQLAAFCLASEQERIDLASVLVEKASAAGIEFDDLKGMTDRILASWKEWKTLLGIADSKPKRRSAKVAPTKIAAGEIEQRPDAAHASPTEPGELSGPATKESATAPAKEEVIALAPAGRNAAVVGLFDSASQLGAMLEASFHAWGYALNATTLQADALKLVLTLKPRFLVVDLACPGVSVGRLCRAIRATEIGRDVYIFVAGAQTDEPTLVHALECGANEILMTPVVQRLFQARVQAAERLLARQEELNHEVRETERLGAKMAINNRRLEHAVKSMF